MKSDFYELVRSASMRPGMYFGSARYDVFVAFLFGYISRQHDGELDGLPEWLNMRLGWNALNVVWAHLLLTLVRGEESDIESLTPDEHAAATLGAGRLLCEFLDHKSLVGLPGIRGDYEKYLRTNNDRFERLAHDHLTEAWSMTDSQMRRLRVTNHAHLRVPPEDAPPTDEE